MKIKIAILFVIGSASILLMSFLFWHAVETNKMSSSFVRRAQNLKENFAVNLGSTGYSLSGVDSDSIYMYKPGTAIWMALDRRGHQRERRILSGIPMKLSSVYVVGKQFWLQDASSTAIHGGLVSNLNARRVAIAPAAVDEIVVVGNNSFILRTFHENKREFTIAKMNLNPLRLEQNTGLLEKQIDGLFCLDGKLSYSQDLNRLVYVHYYRNEFVVFDTLLNLSYRGHTIDTISRARIKVATNNTNATKVLVSPGVVVNKHSTVSGRSLFVHSLVKGQGDDELEFYQSSVIDEYDLSNGKYLHSFNIPRYHGIPMNSFRVHNKSFIAIYGEYLVTYTLPRNDITLDLKR